MDIYLPLMYIIGWILCFVSLFPAFFAFTEDIYDGEMDRTAGLFVLAYITWFALMIVSAPWFIPLQLVCGVLALIGWALYGIVKNGSK